MNLPDLPMSEPDITESDIGAVVDVLRSKRWSLGPVLEAFEEAFARYIGTKYAVGVSSGTTGLHAAVATAGIGPSDQVVTSAFSFVASSNCILYENAEPVFVDIDPDTFNLDPAGIESVLTDRTRALLPIHVFGQVCDMEPMLRIARNRDLVVIEDACEAIGSEHRGRKAGSFGDMAVFGFYPNKQIAAGEGGIVTCDDPALATRLRSLRNQGRDEMGTWLRHIHLGHNYRLGEIAAALGLSQLKRIDDLLARRDRVAGWYNERLRGLDGVGTMTPGPGTTRLSWFVYVIRLHPTIDRTAIVERLQRAGVPSRVYFSPIHLQPYYRERFGYREGMLPVTETVSRSTLALPFHTNMREAEVERVVAALRDAVGASGRDGG